MLAHERRSSRRKRRVGQAYRTTDHREQSARWVVDVIDHAALAQVRIGEHLGGVEHCVKELTSFVRDYGITDLVTWAVPPGMRPEQMNGSLERFVRDVVPRVKAAAAA